MNRPFLLKPSGKDYLWGGRRLNDEFAKNIDMSPLAETWECSTHPDGPSTVASGKHEGELLVDVLRANPQYLGSHVYRREGAQEGELPILIKFIDANADLSVQVHPTDEYARERENSPYGKTEAWYVLDAAKDAHLVYGFRQSVERAQMEAAIHAGTVEKYLQKIPVKKDDVFFVEAGTVHAIGVGALVAEIQENSNLTYRLYDYDRVDKNGNKRPLHVQKALDVARLEKTPEPRQQLRVLRYQPGMARELLCRCPYFEVHRLLINTERRNNIVLRADELSFRVLLCINGCGTMQFDNEILNIYKGDCIFVPADSVDVTVHGNLQFLDVRG